MAIYITLFLTIYIISSMNPSAYAGSVVPPTNNSSEYQQKYLLLQLAAYFAVISVLLYFTMKDNSTKSKRTIQSNSTDQRNTSSLTDSESESEPSRDDDYDADDILFSGMMQIKTKTKNLRMDAWVLSYFVLKLTELSHYKSKEDTKWIGSTMISSNSTVEKLPQASSERSNGLILRGKTVVMLNCLSAEDCNNWYNAINRNIEYLKTKSIDQHREMESNYVIATVNDIEKKQQTARKIVQSNRPTSCSVTSNVSQDESVTGSFTDNYSETSDSSKMSHRSMFGKLRSEPKRPESNRPTSVKISRYVSTRLFSVSSPPLPEEPLNFDKFLRENERIVASTLTTKNNPVGIPHSRFVVHSLAVITLD